MSMMKVGIVWTHLNWDANSKCNKRSLDGALATSRFFYASLSLISLATLAQSRLPIGNSKSQYLHIDNQILSQVYV
jgi:hypothetical protein